MHACIKVHKIERPHCSAENRSKESQGIRDMDFEQLLKHYEYLVKAFVKAYHDNYGTFTEEEDLISVAVSALYEGYVNGEFNGFGHYNLNPYPTVTAIVSKSLYRYCANEASYFNSKKTNIDSGETMDHIDMCIDVSRMTFNIPHREMKMLYQYFVLGMTQSEIAKRHNVATSTIQQHIEGALRRIRCTHSNRHMKAYLE